MNANTETGPPWVPIPNYLTGYPSPTRKLGKAWAAIWAELNAADWTDGVELADRVAKDVGLVPVTLISLMTRAAAAGILDRKLVKVETPRGPRSRTHYRIPAGG